MKQLRVWGIMSCFMLLGYCALAQEQAVTIKGNIKNSANNETVPAVSVIIKSTQEGTYTDGRGNFSISTQAKLPLTLLITSVGFEPQEVPVTASGQAVNISFKPISALGQEVVISATRTPQRILESPVSVERYGTAAIRNASAPNYYDALSNLKGVDLTTSSLTFRTVSTRGFNGSGNLRFNQLIEGMDNQAPGLSFSVGNIIGLTELDVDNVELLPGASSALYGSGGMNGTMLMTGKNPFKYQGLSVQFKQGINHVSDYRHAAAPVFDGEIRYAKAFKNKFAFKISGKYFSAEDWHADDTTDILRNNVLSKTVPGGTRAGDRNYDGVNVFGDEASASLQAFAQAARAGVNDKILIPFLGVPGTATFNSYFNNLITSLPNPQAIAAALASGPYSTLYPYLGPALPFTIPTAPVANNPYASTFGTQLASRTGYQEKDIVNYNTYNFKITGGLYYKINKNVEASLQAYYGTGTTVYTGSDRYSLKNLMVGQYKAEVRSNNWFLRAYTTQENSGDSYTATTAAVAINRAWRTDSAWFQQYTGYYSAARLGLLSPNIPMLPDAQATQFARTQAETGRYLPGSSEYNDAFNKAINTPISQGGAKFTDKSSLYHAEGQYNFSNKIKVVDILVGASYRVYHLNSNGTIFADTLKPINISEYGAYVQLQKKFFKDVLKLTASTRFDKNQNFKGRFTPRFSALIRVAKDNNIRLSFQTAYRFPSTQDQYINLKTPSARLIGGLPSFNTGYRFNTSPAYAAESIGNYRTTFNPTDLRIAPFVPVKPETVNSYEIGYRGLITRGLLIDVYAYATQYKNFIGRVAVGRGQTEDTSKTRLELLSPFTTTNFSFASNSSSAIKASGWGASIEYQVQKGYTAMVNVSGDNLNNVPTGFVSFFNTPKVRYNIGFSNPDVYHHFGFNAIYRWQDKVNWEGTFGSGEIPSFGSLDAHISYTVPKYKSLIKLGATNVFNKYYRSAFGNPYVGGLYYVSIGYNVF